MRFTIDTELQVVIVPNSYYAQIDKLNEVISSAGGKKLEYDQYIRDCFETAIETKVVRQSDVAGLVPRSKKKIIAKKQEAAMPAEGEQK